MTPPDYPGALDLLCRIAANVRLADEGHQTRMNAFDRIRQLLANSNYFESISLATLNESAATKVTDAPANISARATGPARVPSD